jgi:hypothetical protein
LKRKRRRRGINNVPVIQPLPVNSTVIVNGTTANVTMPICDGVVGGPCLDKITGQIIP